MTATCLNSAPSLALSCCVTIGRRSWQKCMYELIAGLISLPFPSVGFAIIATVTEGLRAQATEPSGTRVCAKKACAIPIMDRSRYVRMMIGESRDFDDITKRCAPRRPSRSIQRAQPRTPSTGAAIAWTEAWPALEPAQPALDTGR